VAVAISLAVAEVVAMTVAVSIAVSEVGVIGVAVAVAIVRVGFCFRYSNWKILYSLFISSIYNISILSIGITICTANK
jgi:hypothetical protein